MCNCDWVLSVTKLLGNGDPHCVKPCYVNSNRMKTKLHIFLFGLWVTLLSCGQTSGNPNIAVIKSDTLQTGSDKKEEVRLEKKLELEENEFADSIMLAQVLQDAVRKASKNIDQNKLIEKYEVFVGSIPITVAINVDYHFTKYNPHLIIRISDPNTVFINIYSKGDNEFEQVLSYERWALVYTGDTIRDINGDGLKDFVVNWYGNTGCCLKAFSNVYLQRADGKTFSNGFEFINPTFSPQEQVVRGVCYGHPGETEMYKYKWNKDAVDTVEYIYYEKNDSGEKTGKLIVSNHPPYSDKHKVLKRLNFIPAEYRGIEGFDWFTDNLVTNGNR